MKVAIIGGNFLGCATAHYLRKVHALNLASRAAANPPADSNGGAAPEPEHLPDSTLKLTIFDKRHQLGGRHFQSLDVEGVHAEVGRTLHLANDYPYLQPLVAEANHANPPDKAVALAPVTSPTTNPPAIIRSFGIYDWQSDTFRLRWSDFRPLAALLRARVFCNLLRIPLLLWAAYLFRPTLWPIATPMQRAWLITPTLLILFFSLSPRFWLNYLHTRVAYALAFADAILTYSFTVIVARGARRGVVQHLGQMRRANATTSGVTIGHILYRTGMGPWIKGSMHDFVFTKFKFFEDYVRHWMLPPVQLSTGDARVQMDAVTGMQAFFDMFTADVLEGHAAVAAPSGVALCEALARPWADDVAVRLDTTVTGIVESDTARGTYTVTSTTRAAGAGAGEPAADTFDAVIVCCVPNVDELSLRVDNVAPVRDLFGITGDSMAQERASTRPADNVAQWVAVVAGELDRTFFGVSAERRVPDLCHVVRSLNVFQVERLGASEHGYVYRVVCGERPTETSDVLRRLFTKVRSVTYRKRPMPRYRTRAFSNTNGKDIPNVILSSRCLYAAATDRLACHTEVDIMSAMNAASLFADDIQWTEVDKELDESRGRRPRAPPSAAVSSATESEPESAPAASAEEKKTQ